MQVFLQFFVLFVISCFFLFSPTKAFRTDNFLKLILFLVAYSGLIRILVNLLPNMAGFFPMSVFAVHLLFTPAAYLYLRNLVYGSTLEQSDRVHLLPFIVFCAGAVVAEIANGATSFWLTNNWLMSTDFTNKSTAILNASLFIVTAFYFALTLLVVRHKAISLATGITMSQSGDLLIHPGYMTESFTKEVNHEVQENTEIHETSTTSQRHTLLTEEKVQQIGEVVSRLLLEKKPFLQQRYSLKDLSEDTQIPLHQLSAYINKYCGKNFNDFINEYRVYYCKEKILNQECRSKKLEAVAEESGFNNRNTFAIAFKKVTGVNPSEFLKSVKANGEQYSQVYDKAV
jgi:AraC-like DNA-binding protein